MPLPRGVKTQCVFEPRAIAYLRGALTGASTTLNLPWAFKGLGALLAVDPTGTAALAATLMPPVGPRSKGNRARALITGGSAGGDVLLIEC